MPCALAAAAAQADPGWAATGTRAHPVENLVQRDLLAAGESLHIVLGLKLRDAAGLDAFNAEATRAGSPAYARWLSSEQFLQRHAPSAAQVQAVVDHLRRAGFINIEVAPNRLLVSADGTAGVVRQAFRTELAHFDVDGRRAFANIRDAYVPKALDGLVLSVLGLQNVDPPHTLARVAGPQPQAAVAAHGFNPLAYQLAYGVGSTPGAGNTSVGIISAGNMTQTLVDFAQYRSANGLSTPTPSVVTVGTAGSDTSGTIEWDLDSQSITGITGGTIGGMVFYAATSLSNANITSAYNRAVTDRAVKIVNVSLGECERSAQGDGTLAADDQIFQAGIAQGLFFSVSSGDSGSHECAVLLFKTASNVSVSYPASSPYVVSVGGTTILTDAAGNYASESAWSGSGGGVSAYETRPAYQNGVVSSARRGLPDVALAADPNTGAIIIVNGRSTQVGGTSLASPLFVGLYARIESATGNSHGFANPGLYANIPGNPALVHDVSTGSNGPGGAYNAVAGWDKVTGFGSPIIGNLYSFVAAHPAF
ncbi:MAG: S53 family peptidase [Nevskia sp.]